MKQEQFIDGLCHSFERQKVLKPEEIKELRRLYKDRSDVAFEYFVIDQGLITKEHVLQALQDYYKVPAIDVMGLEFDHHYLTMFPKDEMLRNGFIPYLREGEVLIVIARDPNDEKLLDIIGNYVSYDITFMVGLARDIGDMIEDYDDLSLTQPGLDLPLEEEQMESQAHTKIEETPDPDLREGDRKKG
jgi:MshEN domain